jgi:MFS family permease
VHPAQPPRRAERALDLLNFVLADVRYGLGPYGIIYLISVHGWTEAGIAFAFSFGSIAGLVSQAPIGAMVDRVRPKRALAAGALLLVAGASLSVPLAPGFWPVAAAGVAGALANSTLGTVVAAISLGVVGPERFARRAARRCLGLRSCSGCWPGLPSSASLPCSPCRPTPSTTTRPAG